MKQQILDIIKLSNKIVLISNYKCSKEIEEFTKCYDLVIRFNEGSNRLSLQNKLGSSFNNKTNICVLSGWKYGSFGDMNGFYDQEVLLSRPQCVEHLKYLYKDICIKKTFIKELTRYTQKVSYIPLNVFYDLYAEFNYDHPTTGFITMYYICKYLHKPVDCINFFIDAKTNLLYNAFEGNKSIKKNNHNLKLESLISNSLQVNHIIL